MINTVLCEADELVYRTAFSCQRTGHIVTFKDSGEQVDLKDEYTKTELKAFYTKQGINEWAYDIEVYPILAGKDSCINNLKSMISMIWGLGEHEKAKKFGVGKIENIQFWLSPSDRNSNFRYSKATIPGPKGLGYKAGRGEKPHYYQFVRDLIIDMYGAQEAHGYEADDAIAMRQTSETIISSFDKDLAMVPGLHYNQMYNELFYVPNDLGTTLKLGKKEQAIGLLAFYQQLLTGDAIDNIPGCKNSNKSHHKNQPNFSPQTAIVLLNDNIQQEEDYLNIVCSQYKNTYKENWREALLEVADLVYMVRKDKMTGSEYLLNKFSNQLGE